MLQTMLRIWDCFLLEGPKVLFRFSAALLRINEAGLRAKKETISIMKHLKCCARLAYDADELVRVAFAELKPFPRRKDLLAKQLVYVNALKEKMRRRVIYKRSLTESEVSVRYRKQRLLACSSILPEHLAVHHKSLKQPMMVMT